MDFLNQLMHRMASGWRRLPPMARGVSVLLALAVGAGATYWGRNGEVRDQTWLFSGAEFTANDIARMEAAFGKARLAGAQVDGQRVSVPESQKDVYLKALVDQQALPEMFDPFYSAQERALERDHPFTSQRQRDSWMKLAREREVALIVRKIRGIEEVCVQYDDVETDSFPRRKRRRATVAVRAAEGRQLEHETVQAIRSTVMTAVGVAQSNDITVLDLNAGRAYDGGGGDAVRQAESDYSAAKRRFEEFYQTKITQRLAMFPGAVVAVNVELQRDESGSNEAAPLVPREVNASIALPRSLLVELWRRDRPDFAPQASQQPEVFELRKIEDDLREQIRRSVAPLLLTGSSAVDSSRALVTVDTFADSRQADDKVARSGLQWQAAFVDKEWLIGLGLVGFMAVAWLASRRAATDADSASESARLFSARQHEPGTALRHRGDRLTAAPEEGARATIEEDRSERLRGKLADRVKGDPRTAAETLKHWIGNVA